MARIMAAGAVSGNGQLHGLTEGWQGMHAAHLGSLHWRGVVCARQVVL